MSDVCTGVFAKRRVVPEDVVETYGFKSTKNPPPIEELKDFENDMLKMIQSVKFKQVNNPFLNNRRQQNN